MFVRIWRNRLDLARVEEYEHFVDERSQPMFNAQNGFLGVIFSRRGDEVAVVSFWRDANAVKALETSTSYQDAVQSIGDTGFLVGDSSLDVFEIHAGIFADTDALSARFSGTGVVRESDDVGREL